jgi:hypothetical protein
MMEQEIRNLIEQVRIANTYSTPKGSWTVGDSTLTIKVSDLLKILNTEK